MTTPNYDSRHRAFIDLKVDMLEDLNRAKAKLLEAREISAKMYEVLNENYSDKNEANYDSAYNQIRVEQAKVDTLNFQVCALQGRINYYEEGKEEYALLNRVNESVQSLVS
jgi:hypothetical protein